MDFWLRLHQCKAQWRWLVPLLFACVLGMVGGWYYYVQVGQFRPGHADYVTVWLWPLVSDSPNAVLLWFVAAIAYKVSGWRNKWLDASAFILNIYVGLWTTYIFIAFPEVMGTYDWARVLEGHANPVLFVTHMGMPLLALVLVRDMRKDVWDLRMLAVLAAAAGYIAIDYWGPHIHPAPFLHSYPELDAQLHAVSPWLMVVALGAWIAVVWPRRATD